MPTGDPKPSPFKAPQKTVLGQLPFNVGLPVIDTVKPYSASSMPKQVEMHPAFPVPEPQSTDGGSINLDAQKRLDAQRRAKWQQETKNWDTPGGLGLMVGS
jgi:hypothetical protein